MKLTSLALRQAIRAKYAWPGGYPMFCLCADGEALCMDCAKAEYKLIARARRDNDTHSGWNVEAVDINWEDTDLTCANCGAKIESAYGEEP